MLQVGAAHAAPRQVAVINTASDQAAGAALAAELRRTLAAHATLDPIESGELARALEDGIVLVRSYEDEKARVRRALRASRDAQAVADYARALELLREGEDRLLALEPAPDIVALLAELRFEAGQVHLNDLDADSAVEAFRAVRRLDPLRTELDPRDFRPDIVEAYNQAAVPPPGKATVTVTSPFDGAAVVIDGQHVGATRFTTELAPGVHYITVTSPDYAVTGRRVELAAGDAVTVEPAARRLGIAERTRNRRRILAGLHLDNPEDEPVYLEAARDAAAAAGVDAVVVIADRPDGGLHTALYSGRQDALSSWRRVGDVDRRVLVAAFAPPKEITPPDGPGGNGIGGGGFEDPGPEPPWWKKRWVRATIAGSVVVTAASITLGVLLGGGSTGMVQPGWDPDFSQ